MLSREGMAGVTLGQMAERVGMSKSGLFAHFRSKEDVQIGLLEHVERFVAPLVIEPAMKEPAGLPRLTSFFRHWLGWSHRAGLPGGCPVAAAMFEMDDVEGPVRDKVVAMEAEWRRLLDQVVRQAVARGDLRDDLDVDQFIWELCGIYLSHHTSFRLLRDPNTDARAWTAYEALLERARPAASGRR